MARRAKIVCTLGPACDHADGIRRLIEAGLDVARLNFSHGSHEEHAARAERVRAASSALGKPVALLQDLCGPKIRTAPGGPPSVATGDRIELVAGQQSSGSSLAIDYESLSEDVDPGDSILLGDGEVELRVLGEAAGRVSCRVEHGGALRPRMGVKLPSRRLRFGALTDKDRKDLAFGLRIGVDYVALSFVRSADDVKELARECERLGRPAPIVSKIETAAAVDAIDSIVAVSDAIMVARGDLGVELPPERVPVAQKQIIGTCRRRLRPVIVATEMLQSMVASPRPTRAEASDVANAVFDGADAVMLSAETATGKHPIEACRMMARILEAAEQSSFYVPLASEAGESTPEAIARAACDVAREVGARVLVAFTESGGTARLVSKARPTTPILAFSPDEKTLRRLALYWGVVPRTLEVVPDVDALARSTTACLLEQRLAQPGDRYVMVYGAPVGVRGSTNALRVETVR
jgi:pyruvate kinase